jgi:hypothetical protein
VPLFWLLVATEGDISFAVLPPPLREFFTNH